MTVVHIGLQAPRPVDLAYIKITVSRELTLSIFLLQNMTLEEAETLALSTLKQVMEEKVFTRITFLNTSIHFVQLISLCNPNVI